MAGRGVCPSVTLLPLPLLLLLLDVSLVTARALSAQSPVVSSGNVLHDRNVFTCGFGDSLFFATNFLQSQHLHRHKHVHYMPFANASRADIIVVYGIMPHCQAVCAHFTGLVIYLDNEAGRPVVSKYLSNFTEQNLSNMIYLGVATITLPPTVTKIPSIFGAHTLECSESTVKRVLSRHLSTSHRKTRFLAYAASKCLSLRENVFDAMVNLSLKYDLGTVTAYGACHGSSSNINLSYAHRMGSSSNDQSHLNETSRKHFSHNGVLFQPYKYVLAMENDDVDHYMTEKIFYAYQSGAIPLYWGASSIVHDIFHPDTFIYLNPDNLQPALDRILEIEKNATLYHRILQTPVLLHGEDTIKKYFAVGIPASSALDPRKSNASLSNRIWTAIIQNMYPLSGENTSKKLSI